MANNSTTLKESNSDQMKVAVNSIQRTLLVERICVNKSYPAGRIIPYDNDNLYPNKVKSIAQRSGTTSSAIKTLSKFTSGEGFAGMDLKVNREGQTLWDISRHISDSKSNFNGYALHFNYNIFGQIIEINPINFEFVRWAKNMVDFVVCSDWRRKTKTEETTYKPFNPASAPKEIEEAGGINQYKGQLYYWIPNKADLYTVCSWDEVIDDAQFEAEAKLYGLSSIQNDYSLSGLVTYPTTMDETDLEKLKDELKNDQGSAQAGGVRVIGALPTEGLTNWKWFSPMSRNNIDNLHKNQIETARFNIYAAFQQPPILNGVSQNGMFNEASFADAFNYYNSATETDRKEVEKELSKILAASIWSNVGQIQIVPKKYVTRETENAKPQL